MVAVNPFAMDAVTFRVPGFVAVTAPDTAPVAIPVPPASVTDQVMGVLLVALAGSAVPERVNAVPTVPVEGTPVMLLTATNVLPNVIVKSFV